VAEKINNMPQRPYQIVLQAYGQEGILQECLFALFSFYKLHTEAERQLVSFHIYTDQPAWFRQFSDCPLDLHFQEVTPELIKKWRGAIDFVHRVKIEVLRDFVTRVTGPVLYLDTDVYFTKSIIPLLQRIENGELFMHVAEGKLSDGANPMMEKLHRFFRSQNSFMIAGKQELIPLDTVMWNAGVLGFPTRHAALLDQVLSFTDTVHKSFPKHIVEQFAFSYFFAQRGIIHHSANCIVHYWILSEIKQVLASFFDYFKDKNWEELVHYSELVQHTVLVQEKTSFFINRSVTGKIRQLRWTPTQPDWAALVQQM